MWQTSGDHPSDHHPFSFIGSLKQEIAGLEEGDGQSFPSSAINLVLFPFLSFDGLMAVGRGMMATRKRPSAGDGRIVGFLLICRLPVHHRS